MTSKLEQAARQLLETTEGIQHGTDWNNGTHAKIYRPKFPAAIADLREALAEQETISSGLCGGCAKKAADGWALYCVECWEKAEQEPVAEVHNTDTPSNWSIIKPGLPAGTKLYATHVRTKDLTDDEIAEIFSKYASDLYKARAVIAADREKNRGS